jgi:hypothetical protein
MNARTSSGSSGKSHTPAHASVEHASHPCLGSLYTSLHALSSPIGHSNTRSIHAPPGTLVGCSDATLMPTHARAFYDLRPAWFSNPSTRACDPSALGTATGGSRPDAMSITALAGQSRTLACAPSTGAKVWRVSWVLSTITRQ